MASSDLFQSQITDYTASPGFTRALLRFTDGSTLHFEHAVGKRTAQAYPAESLADLACQSLRMFRLNAKHLQLYFTDGSDLEFPSPFSRQS